MHDKQTPGHSQGQGGEWNVKLPPHTHTQSPEGALTQILSHFQIKAYCRVLAFLNRAHANFSTKYCVPFEYQAVCFSFIALVCIDLVQFLDYYSLSLCLLDACY